MPFQNSSQNDPFPSLFFHNKGLFYPIITAFFIKQSTFFLKKNEQDGFLPSFTSFRYSKNQAIQGSAIRSIRKYKSRKPASAPYTSERLRRPSYPCREGILTATTGSWHEICFYNSEFQILLTGQKKNLKKNQMFPDNKKEI